MADNSQKSTAITGLDATPILRPNSFIHGGTPKEYVATFEVADDASVGSVYRICRLGSWLRVTQILIFCDTLTAGAGDIGLYHPAERGGAVVDADIFASATSIATASKVGLENVYESGATDIANIEKRIWELLGLSVDPNLEYDLALTITTQVTDPGTLAFKVRAVN